jgi:hypothetical protein
MATITKTKNKGARGICMEHVVGKKGDGFKISVNGLNVVEIARAMQMLSETLGDILAQGPDALSVPGPKKKAAKKKK